MFSKSRLSVPQIVVMKVHLSMKVLFHRAFCVCVCVFEDYILSKKSQENLVLGVLLFFKKKEKKTVRG